MSDIYDATMKNLGGCEIKGGEYQKMVLDSKAEKILDLLSFLVLADDCTEIEELITLMEDAVPILKKYCEIEQRLEGES